jgi:hypothetical protein
MNYIPTLCKGILVDSNFQRLLWVFSYSLGSKQIQARIQSSIFWAWGICFLLVHWLMVFFNGFSFLWVPRLQNPIVCTQQQLPSTFYRDGQAKPKLLITSELRNFPDGIGMALSDKSSFLYSFFLNYFYSQRWPCFPQFCDCIYMSLWGSMCFNTFGYLLVRWLNCSCSSSSY